MKQNNVPDLWPQRTEAEQLERLIGAVYGNLKIERPDLTREQVAERLRLGHWKRLLTTFKD